jgi:hypothetical protein
LATGRARQELTERYEVGVGGLVEPLAAGHKFLTKVTEVRDRAAEGSEPKLEKYEKYLECTGLVGR